MVFGLERDVQRRSTGRQAGPQARVTPFRLLKHFPWARLAGRRRRRAVKLGWSKEQVRLS